jgi:2-polyprenyl-3-methyl-5-hydroxy-6-metoxy-1,4-benzoquinol methylase
MDSGMIERSQQPEEGIQEMIRAILSGQHRTVIDVGAGAGKWGRLLAGLVGRIDAIEIWQGYVERYSLPDLYSKVFVMDARDFNWNPPYNVVILGDVLEHMDRASAVAMLSRIRDSGSRVFLTIPISLCPQGEVNGNPHEAHLDQWTNAELIASGWLLLHRGLNDDGSALIGTYQMAMEGDRDESIRVEQGGGSLG